MEDAVTVRAHYEAHSCFVYGPPGVHFHAGYVSPFIDFGVVVEVVAHRGEVPDATEVALLLPHKLHQLPLYVVVLKVFFVQGGRPSATAILAILGVSVSFTMSCHGTDRTSFRARELSVCHI